MAILIFGLYAGVSIVEGIDNIRARHSVSDTLVNYVGLGVSFGFETTSWLVAFRAVRAQSGSASLLEAAQRSKDPTVFTVLLEDSATLAGLAIAGVGLACAEFFQLPILNGVASVLIGLVLAGVARFLAAECKGLMLALSYLRAKGAEVVMLDQPQTGRRHEVGLVEHRHGFAAHIGDEPALGMRGEDVRRNVLDRVEHVAGHLEKADLQRERHSVHWASCFERPGARCTSPRAQHH